MKIDAALRSISQLGIETSPSIYFVEKHPNYLPRVRYLFSLVSQGQLRATVSVVTLAEVLVKPLQTGHHEYQKAYRTMILGTRGIEPIWVDPDIAEETARLRAVYQFRTPDAIHIATAIVAGCDAFLTNDLQLRRVKEIPILVLDELTL